MGIPPFSFDLPESQREWLGMGKRAPTLALKWPLNDILFWVETLDTSGFIKEQNCIVVELVKFTDKWKEKC